MKMDAINCALGPTNLIFDVWSLLFAVTGSKFTRNYFKLLVFNRYLDFDLNDLYRPLLMNSGIFFDTNQSILVFLTGQRSRSRSRLSKKS